MVRGGAGDTVLIGSGTYLVRVDSFSSADDIKGYLSNALQGCKYSLDPDLNLDIPAKFKILEISNNIVSNKMTLFIDYVNFNGNAGIKTNSVFNIGLTTPDKPVTGQFSSEGMETSDPSYIENLNKDTADLVYARGYILIRMKVRIVRKLEDGTCLVENKRSGRIFKVKIKEQM
jgi:hypothetical protein